MSLRLQHISRSKNYRWTNILCFTGKHFLVYESGSNRWTFKQPKNLTGSLDYFMNQSGSLIQYSSSNYVIMEEDTSTFYRVDVETTDNFFLSIWTVLVQT